VNIMAVHHMIAMWLLKYIRAFVTCSFKFCLDFLCS